MSGARQGRRRRLLQEEVLSASREAGAYSPDDHEPVSGEGRRYALSSGSLGSALAKRHFPSHVFAPVAVAAGSVAVVGGLAVLHLQRAAVSSATGSRTLALLDATSSHSLAAWLTSTAMLAVAGMAAMIYAVRRRRVDDYKGRHSLWRTATVVALLLSIDAATDLHLVVGEAMSNVTGVKLMQGGAEWWLAIGGLVLAWVGFRVMMDVKVSKLAISLLVASAVTGAIAVVGPLAGVAEVATSLAQLVSYGLVAASLVAYARFLRHDVAAGVATKPQVARPAEVKIARQTTTPVVTKVQQESDSTEDEESPASRRQRKEKVARAAKADDESGSRWTDGSDGYAEDYDEESPSRNKVKADRKKMRQQKAERWAA
jgi:hypothetical protein